MSQSDAATLIQRFEVREPRKDDVRNEHMSEAVLTEAGRLAVEPYVTNTEDNVYFITGEMSPLMSAAVMARLSRRGDGFREILASEYLTLLEKGVSNVELVGDFLVSCIEDPLEAKEVIGIIRDIPEMLKEADNLVGFANWLDERARSEPTDAILKAKELIDRVVNDYGDDSVRQLTNASAVVERASNLLTKSLEWGRLAAYLEQSTRYIYFDKKDIEGRYRYHRPEHFSREQLEHYERVMDEIFYNYSLVVRNIRQHLHNKLDKPDDVPQAVWNNTIRGQACDAARLMLPTATTSTVGITGSGHAFENLIINLQAGEVREENDVGVRLLNEGRKVLGIFLEKTDDPTRGGATIDYKHTNALNMRRLASDNLEILRGVEETRADIIEYTHEDELDALVPRMLYPYSQGYTLEEIKEEVAGWPIDDKMRVFNTYVGERMNRRHKPGRAFEALHVTYDVVCDYGIFRDLQRHRMVDEIEWPVLTPFYGYEIPELVIESGNEDLFHETFQLSVQLYEDMVSSGIPVVEAQYATLLGHKMHWKMTANLRSLFHIIELRTGKAGHPGYRKLAKQMYENLAEVYPISASAMIFVDTEEDAELTRLAAEKATANRRKRAGLSARDLDDLE